MKHYQAVEPMGFSQGTVQPLSEDMVEERPVKRYFKLFRQKDKLLIWNAHLTPRRPSTD